MDKNKAWYLDKRTVYRYIRNVIFWLLYVGAIIGAATWALLCIE